MSKIVKLLLLLPLVCLAQERTFNYTVTQTTEAVITKETNYKESFSVNQFGKDICIVEFEAQIEGEWHKARGEHTFDNQNTGCKTAAMLARKNLTTSIKPSIITSKAEIVYEENGNTKHIDGYKKGELVDIKNLRVRTDYQKDFRHQGTICKWYYDVRREAKGIKQYNLIACKLSDGWIVEDTF